MENSNENLQEKIAIYEIYNRSKEEFTERSFAANRYYTTILLVILLIILLSKQLFVTGSIAFTFVFSLFGLCVALLMLINQDSYKNLIRIKLGKVLEKLEEELPIKPYTMEHNSIVEYRTKKRIFIFDNMQKLFAFVVSIIFLVCFVNDLFSFVLLLKSMI